MVISYKTDLPTMEELQHPDLPFSGVFLRAGAQHLGKYCEEKNDEFMLCRSELGPRHCINEGKDVTNCTLEFFGKLKKHCYHELDRYTNCIDKSSYDLSMHHCRKTQAAFDKCVLDNLNIPRPDISYFSRPRIYDSIRPPPVEKPQVFDDLPIAPEGPDFPPKRRAKYNSREFAFT